MFPPETSSRGFAATACWENLLPGCSPWGPDSAHRGLTVPAGSSSTSPVSADHR